MDENAVRPLNVVATRRPCSVRHKEVGRDDCFQLRLIREAARGVELHY